MHTLINASLKIGLAMVDKIGIFLRYSWLKRLSAITKDSKQIISWLKFLFFKSLAHGNCVNI